jgi:hypothetical protein
MRRPKPLRSRWGVGFRVQLLRFRIEMPVEEAAEAAKKQVAEGNQKPEP